MTQTPPDPGSSTAKASSESLGARRFSWTRAPATLGVATLGLLMATATLLALEALAPRQGVGVAFDRGLGTYAGFGAVGAVLLIGASALLRRIPGLLAAEDDDADQP